MRKLWEDIFDYPMLMMYSDPGSKKLEKLIEKNDIEGIKVFFNSSQETELPNVLPKASHDVFMSVALLYACKFNKIDIIKYLVEKLKVDVNAQIVFAGKTALMYAAARGGLNIVKYLVEKCNADVNMQDDNGVTALMTLNYTGQGIGIIKYLVQECGANINIQDDGGNTFLIHAIMRRNKDIVKYLTEKCDIDINIKNRYGDTALSLAQKQALEFDPIVSYLMECKRKAFRIH